MKKIITIAWTRPDLIRLSEIIKKLDKYTDHIFVHTWQNFTIQLHDQFFDDLNLRTPDYQLNIKEQYVWFKFIGYMFQEIEKILLKEKPDAILILWDTNSALSAYVAKRLWIPLFHMEAGNRCYDDEVPEEINRRIIDSLSAYLLPYTQRSREHLLQEWYPPNKIIVVWNPITEVIHTYLSKIKRTDNKFILATLHRNENVTNKPKLENIINALNIISESHQIILSVHPKLEEMLKKFSIKLWKNIIAKKPLGFIEFLELEKNAICVLSDSWTVPEECAILKTPCVLIRKTTERPELLENNSMVLSGTETENIIDAYKIAISCSIWEIPNDYKDINTSEKIVKLMIQ